MSLVKLTPSFITNNLQCPPGKKRIECCDTDLAGLYIEVRAASPGQGTFYYRYKDNSGKTCHQKIGRTGDISLADARSKARELKAEITLGADPRGEAKAQRAVLTVKEFFELHYLPHAMKHKRSWKRDEELFRLRISAFADTKIQDLSRYSLGVWHRKLPEQGIALATADHALKVLKHALNLALDWGMLEGQNPATRIPLFSPDNRVDNIPTPDQFLSLINVLRTDPNRPVCLIILFLLSTGLRLRECTQLRWIDVSYDEKVMKVVATNSKSKRIRSIPLNESAMEVLDEIGTRDKFEYVFINHKTGKPYTTVMKVWDRLRKKAGVPNMRAHDARHDFCTRLALAGRSGPEIMALAGHQNFSTTRRYLHWGADSLRDASNVTSVRIKAATQSGVADLGSSE